MADVIDDACGTEAKFTQVALAAQLKRSRQTATQKSEQFCVECGDAIPEKRQQLVPGCQHCTECQQLMERKQR